MFKCFVFIWTPLNVLFLFCVMDKFSGAKLHKKKKMKFQYTLLKKLKL